MIRQYTGIFDTSYLDHQTLWMSQRQLNINEFDQIESLTIHIYNDNIVERKDERSMKGLQLVGFKEQHLHSVRDYVNALKLILTINGKTLHLNNRVAPIVADWPGQIFIRKALYTESLSREIEAFLPILGPLHLSLNSREQILLIHHSFFENLFHFVFGKKKILAKKPRPWRINLLLELARNERIKIKKEILNKFGQTCKDIEYRTAIDLLDNLVLATLDIYAVLF